MVKLLWLLPLAIAAYRFPDWGPWLFAIAVAPLIVFCAIQGTLHEV